MKKFLNRAIISAAAIIVGYWALALPFHLFSNLTGMQMRIVFIAEAFIYFAIFSAFFIIKEQKEACKKRERQFQKKHNERIKNRKEAIKGIIVNNYDIAA